MKSIFLATLGLISLAQSHMLLLKPQAFAISDKPDNGPLVTQQQSGPGNYPCKSTGQTGDYDFDFPRTVMQLGSNNSLQFKGSAVHGGGSCQVSLTKDLKPNASSVFKVIHSIVGGCPARNQAGNMGDDAAAIDPDTYDYTIPEGLESGDYTLAWTWFNKVGNREFYMNCAPITISGGGSAKARRDSSAFDGLPNMFIANIPEVPSQCSTSQIEGADLQFENPGSSLETNNPQDKKMLIPGDVSDCYAPPGKNAGKGGSGGVASVVPSAPTASSAPAAPSAPFAPLPSPSPPASTPIASAPAPPSTPAVAAPTPNVHAPGTAAPPTSGACGAGSQTCTAEGFQCVSATTFGLCANGCMVPQQVASGTQCLNGAITAARKKFRRALPPHGLARHYVLDV